MYVQEDYSLSCDALRKDVKVPKDQLEVDLSRTMAQAFKERGPKLFLTRHLDS